MPYRVKIAGDLGQTARTITDRDGAKTYAEAMVTPGGEAMVTRAELASVLGDLLLELIRIRVGLGLALEQDLESIS